MQLFQIILLAAFLWSGKEKRQKRNRAGAHPLHPCAVEAPIQNRFPKTPFARRTSGRNRPPPPFW